MQVPKWAKTAWNLVSTAGTIHWLLSLGLAGVVTAAVGAVLRLGPWVAYLLIAGCFLLVVGGSLAGLTKLMPAPTAATPRADRTIRSSQSKPREPSDYRVRRAQRELIAAFRKGAEMRYDSSGVTGLTGITITTGSEPSMEEVDEWIREVARLIEEAGSAVQARRFAGQETVSIDDPALVVGQVEDPVQRKLRLKLDRLERTLRTLLSL